MNINNNKSYFFDIDTLVDINSHAWIIDKNYPSDPIMRISKSEFNLIKSGIFKSHNNKISFNDSDYFVSNDMFNFIKLSVSKSNRKYSISNLAISLYEFLNADYVDNGNIDFKFSDNFNDLFINVNDMDDVYIICSLRSKKAYSSIINKLEDKLIDIGINTRHIYYISETFYNYDSDDIIYKKVKLIVQHLVGYKTEDDKFTKPIEKYNDIYFYDDVDFTIYSNIFNKVFNEILNNTESYIKEDIIKDVKGLSPKINICRVSTNSFNKFIVKTEYLKYNNVIRFFENFKR